MQIPEEASGRWVDSCPPPPLRATWTLLLNPYKMSCGYCLDAPVQLLCPCLGLLETSEQRRSYYCIISDFETAPLLLPWVVVVVVVVVPVSIVLLLAWKCMCAAIPPRKLKDGDDATTDRSPPKSHILSSSCCYAIHLDIQDTLFCTPELPQRMSDPSLRLPQEALSFQDG